ncbi:uncharacterized protein LOC131028181 isoform X1 [Cryptomeria japonica]|uniref:uncharacterized protein LOC131028181 isoform X1 n=1 Tax=Cryptomeria japonica TaxID=3369 RepID=UPI0025AB93A1|nr:uncharacterized protein LOC131028181 isoform X1 [Cryptomeria japonica]
MAVCKLMSMNVAASSTCMIDNTRISVVQRRNLLVENFGCKSGILRGTELGRCSFKDRTEFVLNSSNFTSNVADFSLVRARAVSDSHESEAENENNVSENGSAFLPQTDSLPQMINSSKEFGKEKKKSESSSIMSTLIGGQSGGSRTGLFRTPISGGVQSATSAHGLPRPALAVRNLMEQARFAHLCTVMSRMHHRRKGYPFGSLVDFAPDSMGHPIFSFSPLAIHTRNLLADPRCSLVVQIPGWSGLSNARVTIFGDVYPLPNEQQADTICCICIPPFNAFGSHVSRFDPPFWRKLEWAHAYYTAKHQQGASQQWGNFYYYRMELISDVYFIGGFGTVAWVDVQEYENVQPDKIAVDGGEQNLKELNAMFSKPLKELLSRETEVDDAAFISIDSKGTDIRVRQGAQFNVQRLSFVGVHEVETLEEAKIALQKIMDKCRKLSKQT